MALPTSGPLSLFAIFKEINGREPNVGERVSFHDLVQASNLSNKNFPCPFSRFYGYQHIPPTPLEDNYIHLSISRETSSEWRVYASADYAVASSVMVSGSYVDDLSGKFYNFSLTIQSGYSSGSTYISPVSALVEQMYLDVASCSPDSDSVYRYIAQG